MISCLQISFPNVASSVTSSEGVENSYTNLHTSENWIWSLDSGRAKVEKFPITKKLFGGMTATCRIHAFKHNHQYVFTENV